jgi:hypothetical protein
VMVMSTVVGYGEAYGDGVSIVTSLVIVISTVVG